MCRLRGNRGRRSLANMSANLFLIAGDVVDNGTSASPGHEESAKQRQRTMFNGDSGFPEGQQQVLKITASKSRTDSNSSYK